MTTELIIENRIEELHRLTLFIEELGERRGFDMAMVMRLNLALEEVVSNIILYAYPQQREEHILIRCKEGDTSLTFTISDRGIEFDPTKVNEADTTLSAEERKIGGLGIFLVREIMDEVRYERVENENRLIITKKI